MGERILIVDGHPDPNRQRYCHALAEAYGEGARSTGKDVRIATVAEMNIPLLRTAEEFACPADLPAILRAQEDLLWCDHVVLVFPLWLGGPPSLLRSFLEQIARGSFMADTAGIGIQQKLKGRSGRVIVTMGMPALAYRLIFHEHGVRNIMQGVLGFAGVSPVRRTLIGGVGALSPRALSSHLRRIEALGRSGV